MPYVFSGSLTLEGSFAVDTTPSDAIYLERCGTRLHRPLRASEWAISPRAVVWLAGWDAPGLTARLDGLSLPGLRPFTVAVPQRLTTGGVGIEELGLTRDRLYVLSGSLRLFVAVLPRRL